MLRYAEQCFVIFAFLEPIWLSGHSAQRNGQARCIFSREPDQVPSSGALTMKGRSQRPSRVRLTAKNPGRRSTARLAVDPLTELSPIDSLTCRRVALSLDPDDPDDAPSPRWSICRQREDQLVLDQHPLHVPGKYTSRLFVFLIITSETKRVVRELDPGV